MKPPRIKFFPFVKGKAMIRSDGFSLMEMMVVIAIIGILSAIAIPNVIAWRNNAQAGAAARDVYSGFQLAKSEAVESNMNCTVVFNETINGTAFDFAIFLETPVSPNLAWDAGERIIKTLNFSQYPGVSLNGATFTLNNEGNPAVTFRPDGLPVDINGGLGGGDVTLDGSVGQQIRLTNAGSVQIISG